MLEASVEEIGLEEEGCHTVETEQERLDRDGIYGEIKRELIGNEYAGTFGRSSSP